MSNLLTHIVLDVTALSEDGIGLVLTATNAPGSYRQLETDLYGPDGDETPEHDIAELEVPAHVAKHLTTHQAVLAYILAKVGETVGENVPYGAEIYLNPATREYCYAIVPATATYYTIDQEEPSGDDERRTYPTFGGALSQAYFMKQTGTFDFLEISAWQADGCIAGSLIYYWVVNETAE
jgi:hypothetical protein